MPESIVPEPRFGGILKPMKARASWPHTLAVCMTLVLCSLVVSHSLTTRPLLSVETLPPPLAHDHEHDAVAGPFRPRPRPTPPEPPAPTPPQPENDVERKLFPRLEAWLDARALRIEARAETKAIQQVEAAFNEVTQTMDAAVQGADPQLIQGAFGGVFVAKLLAFVKNAVMFVVSAVVLTVIGALVVKYWFIVGPAALFLFVGLPAWSARTFGKKAP